MGNKLGSVEKMHTREQAEYGRDAFAKVGREKGSEGGREGEGREREGVRREGKGERERGREGGSEGGGSE